MRKFLALLLAALMALSLVACTGETQPSDQPSAGQSQGGEQTGDGHPGDPSLPWTGELVLYTSFPQARKEQLVNGFSETYGIEVTLVEAGTSELTARIESEKDNPQGDVLIGGMVTAVYQPYAEYFQEYVPENDANYPDEYKTVDNKFPIYSLEPSIIAVNLDVMEEKGFTLDQLDSYEDLLNPELKGLICMADFTKAATGYEHLVNMLVDMGDPSDNYAAGWDYVGKLMDNITVLDSSGATSQAIATGEYMAGLSYESTICSYMASDYNLSIQYMEEGTIFGCNAAGIIADCKNLRSAQLFMEYITSEEFQTLQAAAPTYTRSIIVDMPEDFPGSNLSDIENTIAGDPEYFSTDKAEVLQYFIDNYQN